MVAAIVCQQGLDRRMCGFRDTRVCLKFEFASFELRISEGKLTGKQQKVEKEPDSK